MAKAEGNAAREQLRMMLQALLKDRFKLELRHETKDAAIYELVERLAGLSGAYLCNQVVVDATGIEGAYDFTLSFTPGTGGAGGPSDVSVPDGGITLFDALEKRNIPALVLMLDHIERKPTEN